MIEQNSLYDKIFYSLTNTDISRPAFTLDQVLHRWADLSFEELYTDFLQILSFNSAYAGSSSLPKTGMARPGGDHYKHNEESTSLGARVRVRK